MYGFNLSVHSHQFHEMLGGIVIIGNIKTSLLLFVLMSLSTSDFTNHDLKLGVRYDILISINRYLIERRLSMESDIEYIQLFMEYESDDMPMVYFYEVDVNDDRFALRAIEIFVDRTVKFYNDLYCDVVEVCPIPTVDELNEKVWGEGFYATIISKDKFDEIWNTGIYNESLTAT